MQIWIILKVSITTHPIPVLIVISTLINWNWKSLLQPITWLHTTVPEVNILLTHHEDKMKKKDEQMTKAAM